MSYLTEDPETYRRLGDLLAARAKTVGHDHALFYLATSPRFFGPVVEQLAAAGLTRETGRGWRRIIIEKPFGTDLASAKALV